MKAYLADSFSDEDGPAATEGKLVYIRGTKEDVRELADFLDSVVNHLETSDACHLHFQDHFEKWSKAKHIDLVIDVGQRES